MARPRKTTKKTAKPTNTKSSARKTAPQKRTPSQAKDTSLQAYFQSIYQQLKLDESYMSLILGAVVVFVLAVLIVLFVGGRGVVKSALTQSPTQPPVTSAPKSAQKTYVLQDGEGLWDVAVKFYGDGYKWTVISDANGLTDNPDNVAPGMKLVIPSLK